MKQNVVLSKLANHVEAVQKVMEIALTLSVSGIAKHFSFRWKRDFVCIMC